MSTAGQRTLIDSSAQVDRLVRKLLDEGERVEYCKRVHWIALVPRLFWVLVFLIAAVPLASAGGSLGSDAALVVVLVGLVQLGIAVLNWMFRMLLVTNRRVVLASGFLRTQTSAISLDKVNDVKVQEPLIGKILHFGKIRIASGNVDGQEVMTFVPHPREVEKLVSFSGKPGASDDAGGKPNPSKQNDESVGNAVSNLERLVLLLELGYLTREEFETAKLRLLGQSSDDDPTGQDS
jgi:hypothetical protein